ncbi:hypothetical protein MKX01_023286 [Papaver californicum]|nr:hypothetical protein MKX01_023286 [Papaver californicum]
MEAIPHSVVVSRHFSQNSTISRSFCKQKSAIKSTKFCSSLTGSSVSIGNSSKNLFTREIWGWVNSKSSTSIKRAERGVVKAEMFGQLTSGLESAWNKLKGEEVLTKDNIVEPMREIRRALLEADISLPVVRRFVQAVSEQAVGIGLIRGVKPDQQLVKIVHSELVKLMGGEVSELNFAKSGMTVILLAGLQGVGKTTVCAKLSYYLKKQGKSSMLVAADVYRPAAIDQLVILGEQVGVPVYTAGTGVKPSEIARRGLEEAKKKKMDVVIVDTAGRLQMKQEDAEESQKKIMSAKFDFNDFLKQTRSVARMGSMTRVTGMIPGMGKVTPAQIRDAEKSLKIMESMIEVMTPEEREKPELLAESPALRKRIAKESGETEQQVSQLVAQLFQTRILMKNLMGVMEGQGGSIPALSGLEEALKAPPGTARWKRKSDSRKQFAGTSDTRPSPRGFGSK